MTQAAADSLFPPARALQGWWRELTSLRPRRLWFRQLHFHSIEGLAEVERLVALDPLQRLLLRSLTSESSLPSFDRQMLTRWLTATADDGLIARGPGGWQPTDFGRG